MTGIRYLITLTKGWLVMLVLIGLTACGGGGTSDSGTGEDSGQVNIGLTDAPGDFSAYVVDVQSIRLTHANGRVVETLPLTTRVDFAQYTDMTEFLTAATVPLGRYVKGELTLDYRNADIWVEDNNGSSVKVDRIIDNNGDEVSQITVSVVLEGRHVLPIAPGIPRHLSLDFDLEKSNEVVFVNDVPEITVKPVLFAQVDPESPKPHRVRGPLKSVDVEQGSFAMYLRPFMHRIRHGLRHFGELTVNITDETAFEIDELSYLGQEGLVALANVTLGTPVIVFGEVSFHPRRFIAREVYAGSSVPGGDYDLVRGTVTARDNGVLTIKGATWLQNSGVFVFNDTVTVMIDESTRVHKQLANEAVTIEAISVGQRLAVAGVMTNTDLKDLQLDARNGKVRMMLSTLQGTVVGVVGIPDQPLPFMLNLSHINGRVVSLYDFSGTGVDAANDADPEFYEIDYGSLNISKFAVDSQVYVRGFVTPFGQAPLDFMAHTIIGKAANSKH